MCSYKTTAWCEWDIPSGVFPPIRSVESFEGGHEIDVAGVENFFGQAFRVMLDVFDDAHVIAQPVHGSPAHGYTTYKF